MDDFGFDSDLASRTKLRREQSNQPYDNAIDDFFKGSGVSESASSLNSSFGNSNYSHGGSSNNFDSFKAFPNSGVSSGGGQQPPYQPVETVGNQIWNAVSKGTVKLSVFLKDLIPYIKRTYADKDLRKTSFARLMLYTLGSFAVQSILTLLMKGVFNSMLLPTMGLALFSTFIYVTNFLFNLEYYLNFSEDEKEDVFQEVTEFEAPSYPTGVSEFDNYESDFDDFDDSDFDENESEVDDFDFNDDFDDDDLLSFEDFISEKLVDVKPVTTEDLTSVVESLNGVSPELVSRRLLLDKYLSMLESGGLKADYVREVSIDNDLAYQFAAGFQEAQRACRIDEDDYSDILSLKERLMTWELSFEKRNMSTAQVAQVGREFNVLLQTDYTDKFGSDVYATVKAVASRVDVTIFKGVPAKVFLKDIIEANRSFFEDGKNELPIALGFDEKGDAILVDAVKESNLLLAGEARSGKSNLGKVIIDQMVALNPPTKVQFMFGDVKGKVSDWGHLTSPHVKRFEAEPSSIVDMLNWVIEYEAPRREKIISSVEGALKIQSYNEVNKDNPLPYLYIVLDEMLAFKEEAEKLDRDLLSMYSSALSVIVSKLPAYGIFLMAVPHRVVNDIIDKTVSTLIPLKMAVKFSQKDLKSVFAEDSKGFEYELKNQGDFAYTSASNKRLRFGHAPLLMNSDTSVFALMRAQRQMWEKLCPEEVSTSYYAQKLKTQEQKNLIEQAFNGVPNRAGDDWLKFDD